MTSNLPEAFVYFTECQLATLDDVKRRRPDATREIARHQAIADGMIEVVRRYALTPIHGGRACQRLYAKLNPHPSHAAPDDAPLIGGQEIP